MRIPLQITFKECASSPALEEVIRERLAALYGTNASLAVAQDAGATEAWLELPFDSAVAPASLSTSSRFAASSPALPA